MAETRFSSEQIREVIARASEIEQRLHGSADVTADMDQVLAAAQEAGLSKDAVVQAMQEHIALRGQPPATGDMVFARSADEHYYAAEVLLIGQGNITVRFVTGGDATLPLSDVRPMQLTPGTRLVCNWPDWGYWTCTVVRYDAATRTIRASDGWGSEESFRLDQVRLERKLFDPSAPKLWTSLSWQAAAMFGAGGAMAGALLTWLFMR